MLKGLLYIAILTTAVMASWVGFSIYHGLATSTINTATSIKITPIPAKFDTQTIDMLKTKKTVDSDLSQRVSTVSAREEIVSPSTESGSIVATNSGGIGF